MTHPKHRQYCIAAVAFAACCYGAALNAQAPNDAVDVARLVQILNLNEGSVVADIGAGSGPLTIGIAPRVGRVFSTDIESARVAEIREAVIRAGLNNITVIEGQPSRTNLPANSCDGIFMRDVYHHFAAPPEMNASLYESLKTGGWLAVIDFPPRSGRTAPPGLRDNGANHGVLPDDLVRELSAVGFADVHQVPWSSPGYFAIVGRKQ